MILGKGSVIIGLTGMSGAGKTTACDIFRENSWAVIDCDVVSRKVVERGKPALTEIAWHFGKEILMRDGTLDRRRLGSLIFSDERRRNELNAVIYPYISYEIIRSASEYIKGGSKFILLDAPTLFESGADGLCDRIVSVTAPIDVCVSRIIHRDGLTHEQAENRLKSQHSEFFYCEKSDFCIRNDGDSVHFKQNIGTIIKDITAQYG